MKPLLFLSGRIFSKVGTFPFTLHAPILQCTNIPMNTALSLLTAVLNFRNFIWSSQVYHLNPIGKVVDRNDNQSEPRRLTGLPDEWKCIEGITNTRKESFFKSAQFIVQGNR